LRIIVVVTVGQGAVPLSNAYMPTTLWATRICWFTENSTQL